MCSYQDTGGADWAADIEPNMKEKPPALIQVGTSSCDCVKFSGLIVGSSFLKSTIEVMAIVPQRSEFEPVINHRSVSIWTRVR